MDGKRADRRTEPRLPLRTRAFFSTDHLEGKGVLHDLSIRGARVEDASIRLPRLTKIHFWFELRGVVFPFRIPATVVRETDTGFAVEFAAVGDLVAQALGKLGARLHQGGAFDVAAPPLTL